MLNTLLFIHLVISILLVVVILLQRTSADGLSGLSNANGGMGLVSGSGAANFLTRTTVVLAVLFFVNAIILANLSSKPRASLEMEVDKAIEQTEQKAVPIAQ